MNNWLERTELLIGSDAIQKLINAHILVVGLGGVGSYAAETLVRAGVGTITIIDGDSVDTTNKNRQLQALDSTIGKNKAFVLRDRFLDINHELKVVVVDHFMQPDTMRTFLNDHTFTFVLDCIDSFGPKLALIKTLYDLNCKFISSMGAGGKLDASKIKVNDVSKTKDCKFAQQIRKSLKKDKIRRGVLCVYSEEVQPSYSLQLTDGQKFKKSFYGTISYMPAMFGMTMAARVIKEIIE